MVTCNVIALMVPQISVHVRYMKASVFITGTGRCGTTFLVRLFTHLGMDTGYNEETIDGVYRECNSGLESNFNWPHRIVKNPYFLEALRTGARNPSLKIEWVVIPIRDYGDASRSRARLSREHEKAGHMGLCRGGLCRGARTQEEQERLDKCALASYMLAMVECDIPTIFLDFTRMTSDHGYLYERLRPMLPLTVSTSMFVDAYNKASAIS